MDGRICTTLSKSGLQVTVTEAKQCSSNFNWKSPWTFFLHSAKNTGMLFTTCCRKSAFSSAS